MCCQKMSSITGIMIYCLRNLTFLPLWVTMNGGILKPFWYAVGVLPRYLKDTIDRWLISNNHWNGFGISIDVCMTRGFETVGNKLVPFMMTLGPISRVVIVVVSCECMTRLLHWEESMRLSTTAVHDPQSQGVATQFASARPVFMINM